MIFVADKQKTSRLYSVQYSIDDMQKIEKSHEKGVEFVIYPIACFKSI